MPEKREAMSGAERAAVFLLGLGEEAAAAVLRHLDPKEVQNVGAAMTTLSSVSNEKIASVVDELNESIKSSQGQISGNEDYVKRVLHDALGEQKARSMLGRILTAQNPKGLETLKWMEPKAVANLLKDEHPQICAIVMMSLDPDQSAQILALLPEEKRAEVVVRVAELDTVNPGALEELDELMRNQLTERTRAPSSKVDGIRTAAQILNFMNTDTEAAILEQISEVNESLTESIRDQMFIFENLMALEDKDMQRLLREVETETLVLSLKGTEESLRVKFFSNMSKRAAELLKEDIEMRGPVKLSDVETAQKEMLTIAARLSDDGEISLGRQGGDEEYV
ncbi:MAG: flagellar motor switch protein FliG [Pseudomonadales bacterium]|nr:flagellar motor switch protein FliG [Pseudomonadales bacterium]